jgi:hypothetical protein
MRIALALFLVVVLGCGSSGPGTTATGGGGGAGPTGGSGGAVADAGADAAATGGTSGGQDSGRADTAPDLAAGDTAPAGECRKDSDCPPIQCLVPPCDPVVCVLGDRGLHQCQLRTHPALESCNQSPTGVPCCRADSECTAQPNGHCVPHSHEYCGGPAPQPGNGCRYDTCTSDADCTAMPNGFCTASYERNCRYGPCRSNADCSRGPGGLCVLATINAGYCVRPAVFCRYSSDPCRADSDCKGASLNGQVCNARPDGHGTVCTDRGPPPP